MPTATLRAIRALRDPRCTETIELFEQLLSEAIAGAAVGAIVVVMYRRDRADRPYNVMTSGLAKANPTYAAGALSGCKLLLDEVALEHAKLL